MGLITLSRECLALEGALILVPFLNIITFPACFTHNYKYFLAAAESRGLGGVS